MEFAEPGGNIPFQLQAALIRLRPGVPDKLHKAGYVAFHAVPLDLRQYVGLHVQMERVKLRAVSAQSIDGVHPLQILLIRPPFIRHNPDRIARQGGGTDAIRGAVPDKIRVPGVGSVTWFFRQNRNSSSGLTT